MLPAVLQRFTCFWRDAPVGPLSFRAPTVGKSKQGVREGQWIAFTLRMDCVGRHLTGLCACLRHVDGLYCKRMTEALFLLSICPLFPLFFIFISAVHVMVQRSGSVVPARSRLSSPSARGHYLTPASPAAAPISFDPEGISGDRDSHASIELRERMLITHTHSHACVCKPKCFSELF